MTNELDPVVEAALKQMPCPECGRVGHLASSELSIKAHYKDQVIQVEGAGWICEGGCDTGFMTDAMVEEFASKKEDIDGGQQKFIEVDRTSGRMVGHSAH